MKKHNKKAFTLVELLVTIAIIAILAVVSVVGYSAFTQKARDSVAQQELSQVVNILIADDAENDKYDISTTDGLTFKVKETETYYSWDDVYGDFSADLATLGTGKATDFGFETDATTTHKSAWIKYTAKDGTTCYYDFTSRTYSATEPVAD